MQGVGVESPFDGEDDDMVFMGSFFSLTSNDE